MYNLEKSKDLYGMISELKTPSSVSYAAFKFVSFAMKFQILSIKEKNHKNVRDKKMQTC